MPSEYVALAGWAEQTGQQFLKLPRHLLEIRIKESNTPFLPPLPTAPRRLSLHFSDEDRNKRATWVEACAQGVASLCEGRKRSVPALGNHLESQATVAARRLPPETGGEGECRAGPRLQGCWVRF